VCVCVCVCVSLKMAKEQILPHNVSEEGTRHFTTSPFPHASCVPEELLEEEYDDDDADDDDDRIVVGLEQADFGLLVPIDPKNDQFGLDVLPAKAPFLIDEDGDAVVCRCPLISNVCPGPTRYVLHCRRSSSLDTVGTQLWYGALVLSDFLLSWPRTVSGKLCVEFGAGIGLCSLVAARQGASTVYITDVNEEALRMAARNVQQVAVAPSDDEEEKNNTNVCKEKDGVTNNMVLARNTRCVSRHGEQEAVAQGEEEKECSTKKRPSTHTHGLRIIKEEEDGLARNLQQEATHALDMSTNAHATRHKVCKVRRWDWRYRSKEELLGAVWCARGYDTTQLPDEERGFKMRGSSSPPSGGPMKDDESDIMKVGHGRGRSSVTTAIYDEDEFTFREEELDFPPDAVALCADVLYDPVATGHLCVVLHNFLRPSGCGKEWNRVAYIAVEERVYFSTATLKPEVQELPEFIEKMKALGCNLRFLDLMEVPVHFNYRRSRWYKLMEIT